MTKELISIHMLISIIVPKRRGERHIALYVRPNRLQWEMCHSPMRSPKTEPWIWIDWQLACRCLVNWIQARSRYITRRCFYTSRDIRA